jgi:hypothetical protein
MPEIAAGPAELLVKGVAGKLFCAEIVMVEAKAAVEARIDARLSRIDRPAARRIVRKRNHAGCCGGLDEAARILAHQNRPVGARRLGERLERGRHVVALA